METLALLCILPARTVVNVNVNVNVNANVNAAAIIKDMYPSVIYLYHSPFSVCYGKFQRSVLAALGCPTS